MERLGNLWVPPSLAHKFQNFTQLHDLNFSSSHDQTIHFLTWWQGGTDAKAILNTLQDKKTSINKNEFIQTSDSQKIDIPYLSSPMIPRVPIVITTSPFTSAGTKNLIPITHFGVWQTNLLSTYGPQIYGPSVQKKTGEIVPTSANVLQFSFDRYGYNPVSPDMTPVEAFLSAHHNSPLFIHLKPEYKEINHTIGKNVTETFVTKPHTTSAPLPYYDEQIITQTSNKLIDASFDLWEKNLKQNLNPTSEVAFDETNLSQALTKLSAICHNFKSGIHNIDENINWGTETMLKKSPKDLLKILSDSSFLAYTGVHTKPYSPSGYHDEVTIEANKALLNTIGRHALTSITNNTANHLPIIEENFTLIRDKIGEYIMDKQLPKINKVSKNLSQESESLINSNFIKLQQQIQPSIDKISKTINSSIEEGMLNAKKTFSVTLATQTITPELVKIQQNSKIVAPSQIDPMKMNAMYIGSLASLKAKIKRKVKHFKTALKSGAAEAKESFKRSRAQEGIDRAEATKTKQNLKIAKLRSNIAQSQVRSESRMKGTPLPPTDVPPPPVPVKPTEMFIGGDIFTSSSNYYQEDEEEMEKEDRYRMKREISTNEPYSVPHVTFKDPRWGSDSDREMFREARKHLYGPHTVIFEEQLIIPPEPTLGEHGEPGLRRNEQIFQNEMKQELKKKTEEEEEDRNNEDEEKEEEENEEKPDNTNNPKNDMPVRKPLNPFTEEEYEASSSNLIPQNEDEDNSEDTLTGEGETSERESEEIAEEDNFKKESEPEMPDDETESTANEEQQDEDEGSEKNEQPPKKPEIKSTQEQVEKNSIQTRVQRKVGCDICSCTSTCYNCGECRICCRRKNPQTTICYRLMKPKATIVNPTNMHVGSSLENIVNDINNSNTLNPTQPTKESIGSINGNTSKDDDLLSLLSTKFTSMPKPVVTLRDISETSPFFSGYVDIFSNSYDYFKKDVNKLLPAAAKTRDVVFLNTNKDFIKPHKPEEFLSNHTTGMAAGLKIENTDIKTAIKGKDGTFIDLMKGTVTRPNNNDIKNLNTIFTVKEIPGRIFVTLI